jgi:F-type H+-transporting ATPase subunit b
MLDFDITTIILEIVNFLVLAALLYHFVFKRVVRNVEKRAVEKEQLLHDLSEERAQVASLQENLDTQFAQIDQNVSAIIAKAQQQIDAERATMLKEVHAEAERILKEAQVESSHIQQQAMEEYHNGLLKVIFDISGQLIHHVARPEYQDTMVQELSDKVLEWGRKETRQLSVLRRSMEERKPTASIKSATELTPDQQRLLMRTFSALADRTVDLEMTIDPDLVIGIETRIGDMVVENSISSKMTELGDRVSQALKETILNE